ncbi:SET domain-containing protein SmydA-8 [Bradysia coprophila]|uniref:SET domain-containing protein SmydA-8 n=1 Tax=Bradysia coprophila TaxID=38358 RepID=UPI00187DCCF9|nr:SET domain-containing protein SmydA-8 [Bradysia coprophila]
MPHYHHKKKKNHRKHTTKEDVTESVTSSTSTSDTDKNEDEGQQSSSEPDQNNNDQRPYEIANSKVMGRYLVSARNLKAGEVVIVEKPIVIGPCGEPVCLGCYIPIPTRSNQYKCPGCGWRLCGPKCVGLKSDNGHSSWECSTLREKRVADHLDRSKGKELIKMYEAIAPFRCLLLKKHDPKRWERLIKMEAHNDIRRNISSLWNRNQEVVVNRLRNVWGFNEFSEEEIHTMCGILEVNCFEIGQNGSRARALYDEAFLLAHDCSANTSHTDNPINYEMTIRVTRDVPKGDAITLSYAYTLQGTLKRREHLQEGKFFWCQCKRCSDPTELGTYSSAIQCPKCHGGLILSTDPLDQDAPWKCRACAYIVTGRSMLLLVDTVFKELDSINSNDVLGFEEFLEKYRNVFHKNHYLCICAKHSLFQLYGRSEKFMIHELSVDQLRTKENYCRDILDVVDLLEPGLSKLRGVIMYELHAPVMIQATRLFETGEIKNNELKKRLREVIRLLKDSEQILKMEPDGSNEYTMSVAARDALQRIGKV